MDRICDGIVDCNGSEDELGGLGTCMPAVPNTAAGCCSSLLVNGDKCVYSGNDYDGRHTYECDNSDDTYIFSTNSKTPFLFRYFSVSDRCRFFSVGPNYFHFVALNTDNFQQK